MVIPDVNKTMTSLGGKLTAMPSHPTKRENKAEELTYLSTNIRYARSQE